MAAAEFTTHVRTADGWTAPVTVTRKRVRNLNLRVRADGSVTLSIPWRTSAQTVQDFLDRKARWIRERVERRTATPDAAPIPFDGPEAGTLPLWGKLVNAAEAFELDNVPTANDADFGREYVGTSPSDLQTRINTLYRTELARALPDVASQAEKAMGVHASRWQIRRMKTRWGSCTPKTGAIRINSALAAYPPTCLDFVVAHELTHLMEPSHNQRFHMLIDVYCPDNRDIARLLKKSAREVAREREQRIF